MNPDFLGQHEALTRGVGVAPLLRTLIEVRGSDRATFLHAFSTNDVKKLTAGRGCEAFITSPQGKTLGHVFVFKDDDSFWLDTTPAQAETLVAHFDRYLISEDVQFIDRTAEWSELLVAGLGSLGLFERLANIPIREATPAFARGQIAGRSATVCRVPYAGEPSFFVLAGSDDVAAIQAGLQSAGATLCEPDAVEAARIEAGVPLFGRDIAPENLPQEVGRDAQAISFTKGCYLGQETVARIDALGHVNKQLVGVKFASEQVPAGGTPLRSDGKPAGEVTSAAWSPRAGAPLALAYVKRLLAKPGTRLESDAGNAEVVALPL